MSKSILTIAAQTLAAACAVAALACPAQAQDFGDSDAVTMSVHVSLRDLDLNSPKGVKTLKSRVTHAVRKVCEGDDATAPLVLSNRQAIFACRARAEQAVFAALPAPYALALMPATGGSQFAAR